MCALLVSRLLPSGPSSSASSDPNNSSFREPPELLGRREGPRGPLFCCAPLGPDNGELSPLPVPGCPPAEPWSPDPLVFCCAPFGPGTGRLPPPPVLCCPVVDSGR